MQNSITWVGMDVHAENIVLVAVRGRSDAVVFRAEFPNTPKGRERLAGKLAENAPVRCVYEAGPCGYELRRFLEGRGIECDVAAPALIPRKPGDRVKTDRKDAEKLARCQGESKYHPLWELKIHPPLMVMRFVPPVGLVRL